MPYFTGSFLDNRVPYDASKTIAVQLSATKVALVKQAPPAKLLSVSAAGGVRPQILPKANMTMLIIRPRLPSTCVAPGNSAVGSGNATVSGGLHEEKDTCPALGGLM